MPVARPQGGFHDLDGMLPFGGSLVVATRPIEHLRVSESEIPCDPLRLIRIGEQAIEEPTRLVKATLFGEEVGKVANVRFRAPIIRSV